MSTPPPTKIIQADICIVGAGIAGCALAKLLQREGKCIGLDANSDCSTTSSKSSSKPFPSSYILLEKDSHFHARKQGYGLTMQQGGTALKRLGLAEIIQKEDTVNDAHYVFAPNGKLDAAFGREINHEGWMDDGTNDENEDSAAITPPNDNASSVPSSSRSSRTPRGTNKKKHKRRCNLHLPRQRLRELLAEGLEITWDYEVVKYTEIGDVVEVLFRKTGSDENLLVQARAVVACDGIHSQIRKQMMHGNTTLSPRNQLATKEDLQYLGSLVILGMAPNKDHFLYRRTTFQTVDESSKTRIFMMPFLDPKPEEGFDGEIFWQLSFPMKLEKIDEMRKGGEFIKRIKELALEKCKDWHHPIPEILKNTEIDRISATPVYDRGDPYPFLNRTDSSTTSEKVPPLPKQCGITNIKEEAVNLSNGSLITLIGDAAHSMSPFKGQGANQALLDAVELGDMLLKHTEDNKETAKEKAKPKVTNADGVYLGKKAQRRLERKMQEEKEQKLQESGDVESIATKIKDISLDDGEKASFNPTTLSQQLRLFETKMYQRTISKVAESRRIAIKLHLEEDTDTDPVDDPKSPTPSGKQKGYVDCRMEKRGLEAFKYTSDIGVWLGQEEMVRRARELSSSKMATLAECEGMG